MNKLIPLISLLVLFFITMHLTIENRRLREKVRVQRLWIDLSDYNHIEHKHARVTKRKK